MSNSTATFTLVVWTQLHENYGAHNWGGEGVCPQHWKAKGGSEYALVKGFTLEEMQRCDTDRMVEELSRMKKIECDNDYYREYIIGWDWYTDSNAKKLIENPWNWSKFETAQEMIERELQTESNKDWEYWEIEQAL